MADSREQYRTALYRETARIPNVAMEEHNLRAYHLSPEYVELKRQLPYRRWERNRNILSHQFEGKARMDTYQRGSTETASRPTFH